MKVQLKPAVGMALMGVALAGIIAMPPIGDASDPTTAACTALAALLLGLMVATAALVPWRRYPVSRADQYAALEDLPSEHVERGKALYRQAWQIGIAANVAPAAVLVTAGLTPVGPAVFRTLGGLLGGSWLVQVVLAFTIITAVTTAVRAPFAVAQYRLYRRSGIVTKAWGKYLVTKAAANSILKALLLACFYAAVAISPDRWWLWMLALLTIVVVGRVLLSSQTPPSRALESSELRERLLSLADTMGVKVDTIYKHPMSKMANGLGAGVSGVGSTKRIMLHDMLLDKATNEEIAFVVAHELVHAKREDALGRQLLVVMQLGLALCGLYLAGSWTWLLSLPGAESLTDPAAVGLLLVLVSAGMATSKPYRSWVSRRQETNADWHALQVTDDPEACERYWHRVVEVNRTDPSPGVLAQFAAGSHPAMTYRIAMARAFTRQTSHARAVAEGAP